MAYRIARALFTLGTSKEGRQILLVILITVTMPIWLTIFVYTSINEGGSIHNKQVVDAVFNGAEYKESVPEELEYHLQQLILAFDSIDESYNKLSNVEEGLEIEMVKILLFSFKFEDSTFKCEAFNSGEYLDCFLDYYEEDVIVIEDDPETIVNEEVINKMIKIVPIENQDEYITNVANYFGEEYNSSKRVMTSQIKEYLNGAANEGENLSKSLKEIFIESSNKEYSGGSFSSPLDGDWKEFVTSEYGPREPFKLPNGQTTSAFHNGIDLARDEGTSLFAVNDGEVVLTSYSNTGLGIYCVIDHGGGILTVYGHCSKLFVYKGQKIKKDSVIAEIGSTGNSTGPHVHFMVYENSRTVNPREWLP